MTRKTLLILVTLSILLGLAAIGCNSESVPAKSPEKVSVQDMYGRTIEVPGDIKHFLCTGSLEMLMAFMIAPDKISGLNFAPNGNLLNEKYRSLPIVGGWFGKQSGNYEEFIALGPDVIIEGREDALTERQAKFGSIPVIGLKTGESLRDYPAAMQFLGNLLNKNKDTDRLLDYYETALRFADGVKESKSAAEKVTVYYAEGNNGLSTDPAGSAHTELIDMCGGLNVADISLAKGYGMIDVSMEQVFMWDPDIIIIGRASQAELYSTIMNDSRWQKLRAVREGKVFVRPEDPFSWFDGPTGPNQVVGIYWMVHQLYPEQITLNKLKEKVKEFYQLFYHYDLSETELARLLGN